jgi:hypothetical protein
LDEINADNPAQAMLQHVAGMASKRIWHWFSPQNRASDTMIQRFFTLLTICFILIGIISPTTQAQDDDWRKPLANRNQFPLALLFLDPEPESGVVLSKGRKSISFNFNYSNVLLQENSTHESLLLDMEYLASTLGFRAGLGNGIEAALSLPFYTMHGGFLDPAISQLHETFGFPNKFRGSTPTNLFQYHYRVDGTPILERTSGGTWIGDLTLQARKSVFEKNPLGMKLAVSTAMKLPTGSKKTLTGSNAADVGIGIAASRVTRRAGGYFHFNYIIPGSSAGLETRNFISLTAAGDWRFKTSWPNLALVVQYEHLQRFLKSELELLKQSGRQMILGLRWKRSDRFYYEWRLAEDISVTASDFTFGFQITTNWPKP